MNQRGRPHLRDAAQRALNGSARISVRTCPLAARIRLPVFQPANHFIALLSRPRGDQRRPPLQLCQNAEQRHTGDLCLGNERGQPHPRIAFEETGTQVMRTGGVAISAVDAPKVEDLVQVRW